jgi:hypothetical protein
VFLQIVCQIRERERESTATYAGNDGYKSVGSWYAVSDHRGARLLLLADPGELWLSAGEQTADGLDEDSVRRPGLQTAGLLEGQDAFDPPIALVTGRALGALPPEDTKS